MDILSYDKEGDLEERKLSIDTKEEDSSPTTPDLVPPSEGGLRAWSVVLGVWLTQFCTFGYTNAHGVYNDFYVRNYLATTSTSSQISWIGSVQLFLVLTVGLVTGRTFDAGYFYHLMIGGSILMVFCLFMISITTPEHYYQACIFIFTAFHRFHYLIFLKLFLAQGLGIGIAVGVMYIPALGIISHYFERRRALATGIATTGSAFGGAIHPIMLNALFHGPVGFNSGVKISAGMIAGLLVISLLLMKPRYPQNRKKAVSILHSFRVFLRDLPYVIMILGTTLTLTGLYYPIFFLQLNSIKNGIAPGLAFYTIAILNGSSVIGRVIPNLFVYRFGPFNVIIPCVLIASALVFCTLAVKDVAGTMVFAILYGFFSGSYIGLLAPVIGSTAVNDSEIGARLGVCFTFTGFGGLIGTPIAGALLSSSFIWWRPILFSGLCVFSGALCFFTSRFLIARRKGTSWL
ncbi:MFS general substrate transporter [Phlegmacium glaucopus]|nr:MFS general substrate transporter [Phlegmacium glaucopus]